MCEERRFFGVVMVTCCLLFVVVCCCCLLLLLFVVVVVCCCCCCCCCCSCCCEGSLVLRLSCLLNDLTNELHISNFFYKSFPPLCYLLLRRIFIWLLETEKY